MLRFVFKGNLRLSCLVFSHFLSRLCQMVENQFPFPIYLQIPTKDR